MKLSFWRYKKAPIDNIIHQEERNDYNDDTRYLDIDEFLQLIGPFGKSQKLLVAMFCIIIIPSVYQTLIMSFAGSSPPWKCAANSSECNTTLIYDHTMASFHERCNMSRDSWVYTKEKSFSIVTEWDLICEEETKTFLANSAMFVGWAIGAVILGMISDRYGRKIVLFPSLVIILVSAFASGFVQEFWMFFALRLLIGLFQAGVGLTLFVMASELVGPNYRSLSGTTLWFAFTLALCVMGLQAWLIPKWRTLEIILSIPYIFVLLFYKFIPESVRWCRVNGKIEQAEQILKKTAKTNKYPWPNAKLSTPPKSLDDKKVTIKDIFIPCSIGLSTLIQGFGWFVNGMVYYGISLASDNLGGDMYRDFVLTSLVEIPANILVIIFTNKFGRKSTVISSMVMGGFACIGVAFVPNIADLVYKWSRVVLGMLGKLCITISFNGFYIWSCELYPTIVRSQGMGLLLVISRIGAAAAPWVAQWLGHFNEKLPFGVMGVITLLSATTLCVLKETLGKTTAETLEDAIEANDEDEGKEMQIMA